MLIKLKTKAYLLRKARTFCMCRNSKKLQKIISFLEFCY